MGKTKAVAARVAASVLGIVVAGSAMGRGGAAPAPTAAPTTVPAVGEEVGERTVEDGGTGPFKAIAVGDTSIPTHTVYRPKDLAAFGERVKLPIYAWGNGGCSNSNSGHQNYLSEIASQGFLVVAIGPAPTGAAAGGGRGAGGRGGGGGGGGTTSAQLIDAVNWAIAQNKDPKSRYFNKIDITKVAVGGHSCGGLQALEVSTDPRITTTLVLDSGILNAGDPGPGGRAGAPGAPSAGGPATAPGAAAPGGPGPVAGGPPGGPRGGAPRGGGGGGALPGMPPLSKEHLTKLHGPVFYLLGGESDIAYANGMDDFKRIEKLPTYVANRNVGHGGTFGQPHGAEWAMVSTAWLKWQLKGDATAGQLFTGNPSGLSKMEGWTVDKKNIP